MGAVKLTLLYIIVMAALAVVLVKASEWKFLCPSMRSSLLTYYYIIIISVKNKHINWLSLLHF